MRIAGCYSSDPGEIEDIAQEALLRAWRGRASLRDATRRRSWLAVIVRNEAARLYSKPRPEPSGYVSDEPGAEDDHLVSAIDRVDLRAAIVRLDHDDRKLLWLRYGEDLTQASIAGLLAMPEGTVKVKLHRARRKIREVLKP